MRITRTGTYMMTVIAAVFFLFLTWLFDDIERFSLTGPFFSQTTARGDHAFIDGTFYTYLFLALIIVAGIVQAQRTPAEGVVLHPSTDTDTPGQIQDPGWWRLILGNTHLALLWLPLRFYVAREWLAAGEHKLRSDGWMDGGAALEGYWTRAVSGGPEGSSLAVYGWYHDFPQYMLDHDWATWFTKLIALGETAVGLGLLVGALVGSAAFFGTLLDVSFMLAGTVSSNPVMFGLTVFIILGWKVAGWWGIDHWLLPALGTPWYRGEMLSGHPRRTDSERMPGETQYYT